MPPSAGQFFSVLGLELMRSEKLLILTQAIGIFTQPMAAGGETRATSASDLAWKIAHLLFHRTLVSGCGCSEVRALSCSVILELRDNPLGQNWHAIFREEGLMLR